MVTERHIGQLVRIKPRGQHKRACRRSASPTGRVVLVAIEYRVDVEYRGNYAAVMVDKNNRVEWVRTYNVHPLQSSARR